MPKDIFRTRFHFLPLEDTLTADEILTVVRALVPIGVHRVGLTGGGSLLRAIGHYMLSNPPIKGVSRYAYDDGGGEIGVCFSACLPLRG